MYEISKSDWKKFREKIADWQERYMERLVQEYIDFLSSGIPASEKFWGMEKRIKQDRKCPGVLIEMRKSTAVMDIVNLICEGVITLDDLNDFSDEFRETAAFLFDRLG